MTNPTDGNTTYIEAGDELAVAEYVEGSGLNLGSRLTSIQESSGRLRLQQGLRFGTGLPYYQFNVGAITGGVTNSIAFNSPLPPDSLRAGWWVIIDDITQPEDPVQVKTVSTDNAGDVLGFTAMSPFQYSHLALRMLFWEPLLDATAGHGLDSVYYPPRSTNDPQGGVGLAIQPKGGPQTVFLPDGSLLGSKGPVIDAQGRATGITPLALDASAFQLGLERQGFTLFDANTYNSATQAVDLYNNGVHTTMSPNSAGFYNGTPSASLQACWTTAVSGQADVVMALTVKGTNSTVRWSDTQIKDEDGTIWSLLVNADLSFVFPIYVPASAPTYLGSHANLTRAVTSPGTKLYVDLPVASLSTVANDVWVVNPGGSTMEKVTVSSLDTTNNALNVSALVHNHNPNEMIVMYSASGGTVVIGGGGPLDGNTSLGSSAPDIAVIAVGFLDNSSNWYRGWWGDPTWTPPYGTTATWLGRLSLASNTWYNLQTKASTLGLYKAGNPNKTITGLEVAAYQTGSTVTVYFDAMQAGFAI